MKATQETILVVEDEAVTALDIQQSLRSKGFDVPNIAASAEEAIALVRQRPPDLVLMDIRLGGGMDGIEAAQVIRREFNVPVVFLTAFADPETFQRAKLAEPCAYVVKPFEDTMLATTIEIAVHKHRAHEALVLQAAEALRLSEDRFRQLTENITDHGVQLLDGSGRILSWNPGSRNLHYWEAAEVLGKDVSMLYPEEDVSRRSLETALQLGRQHDYCRQVRKDNSRFSAEVITIALHKQGGVPAGYLRVARAIADGHN